ncbi:MAG: alpha/beta hydrolase [Cytophagales bacterium]|nr:MAG: alpha/beta hydrolase [Cytophagales bacterium]
MKSELLKFQTAPQVTLIGEAWGDAQNPTVLLLHGGGQTRHSWGDTAKVLAENGWYAIAIDARGHGDSSWSPDGIYKDKLVSDLRSIIEQLNTAPALVGASMGGLTSLIAEGESEKSIASALILVDIAPKVEQKGVERIFSFMSANVDTGFATLEEAADAVAKYLPHRPKPATMERLSHNLRKREDGRYYWHWDPKILEGWKTTTPEEITKNTIRLYDAAKRLKVPTLIVRGGMSDVVSEKVMAEFLDMVPHVESVDVSGAGHMVAGDSNHAFTNAVISFLKKNFPPKQ